MLMVPDDIRRSTHHVFKSMRKYVYPLACDPVAHTASHGIYLAASTSCII